MTDGTGSRSYVYDDLNNPTSLTTTYTGVPAKTISYGFYPDGSRQTMSTPAGSFSYLYDKDGRLSSLTNSNSEVSSWSYLDNGWLSTQQLTTPAMPQAFTVATTTYTRNATGTLTDLINKTGGGGTLSDFGSLSYDGAGNRLSVTANIPVSSTYSGTTTYQYDSLDELTKEYSPRAGIYTNNFAYDAAGNPTTLRGVTQTYNANNQNTLWTFDLNGNPTSYQSSALAWDPENRMTAYGSALTCGYRADSLRAWKKVGSVAAYFLYDGAQPVIEMNASGNVTAVNTFGPSGLLSRTVGTTTTFYTFDPQGNVCQRLNSTGAILSTHAFDAFGNELGTPSTEPWAFGAQAGYYTDRETGLQLLGLRYYDATQARFLNRDPSGYQGGINLYNCVHNSPTSLTDPTGLGDGDMWYDGAGRAGAAAVGTALGFYNARLTDPSLGLAGDVGAALLDTGIQLVGGFFQLPRMLGHLGEGTECFADHPSWGTLPGLLRDMAVAGAAVGGVAAAGLGAADEGAAAAASDVAPGEAAAEGGECSGTGCFVAGTPVRMADGSTKPVEQIRTGDRVQSRDPQTGVVAAKRVAATFIHTVDHTVVLTLPSGEEIETTEVHPFYVEGRGFVEAGKLGIGTSIVTRAGPTLAIARIERRPGVTRVYNFEVEGFHTYFVGESDGGVWVHNAGLCDPEGGGSGGAQASNLDEVPVGDVSGGTVSEDEALDLAEEWLGPKYTEASPGRFTSETFPGRQFRMKAVDLGGKEPHVHFESIGNNGRDILVNLHLYLR